MKIRVAFDGEKEMKARIAATAREFPKQVRKGAREVAEEYVLAPAVELAPKKSGKLARSGKVSVSIRKGKEGGKDANVLATVKFTEPYATLQHETHKTKSKYLEKPLRDLVPHAGEKLAEKINVEAAAK